MVVATAVEQQLWANANEWLNEKREQTDQKKSSSRKDRKHPPGANNEEEELLLLLQIHLLAADLVDLIRSDLLPLLLVVVLRMV